MVLYFEGRSTERPNALSRAAMRARKWFAASTTATPYSSSSARSLTARHRSDVLAICCDASSS
jgi:hypothetical protein